MKAKDKVSLDTASRELKGSHREEIRDANTCMALGVGVGALGAGAAALAGAACPLCVVIAPALIGTGALKRLSLAKSEHSKTEEQESSEAQKSVSSSAR